MKEGSQIPHDDYSVNEILAEAFTISEEAAAKDAAARPKAGVKAAAEARQSLLSETGSLISKEAKVPEEKAAEKPKKEKKSFFRRRKEKSSFREEDDIYYGLQLRSLEEYRKEYEKTISFDAGAVRDVQNGSSFPYLFTQGKNEDEAEISEIFEHVHQERKKRLEKIMRYTGADTDEIFQTTPPVMPPMPPTVPGEPSVTPGPALEPEPAQEPPAAPTPAEIPGEPTLAPGPALQAEHPAESTLTGKTPGALPLPSGEPPKAAETSLIQSGDTDDEPPVPVKEPVLIPHTQNDIPPAKPAGEPDARPAPARSAVPPMLVIVLDNFDEVLAAEAAAYPPQEMKRPEPIQFPAKKSGPNILSSEEHPAGLWSALGKAAAGEAPLAAEKSPEIGEPLEAEKSAEASESAAADVPQAEQSPQAAEPQETEEPVEASESAAADVPQAESESPQTAEPQETEKPVELPESAAADVPQAESESPQAAEPQETQAPAETPENAAADVPQAESESAQAAEPQETEEPAEAPENEATEASWADEDFPQPEPRNSGPSDNAYGVSIPFPVSAKKPVMSPAAAPVKKKFRLFGSDEPENEPDEEFPQPLEELDDFSSPQDAPAVQNELITSVRKLLIRLTATGIFLAVLLFLTVTWEHPAPFLPNLHNLYSDQVFLILQNLFLGLTAAFCVPTLRNGLSGLFNFQANADSAASGAFLASLVQNCVLLAGGNIGSGIYLYTVLAALALFLNTAGKFSMERRILMNFRFLVSKDQKYGVQIFDDYNTALQLAKDCVFGEPKIACQKKASFLGHFLRLSYAPDPSEHMSQVISVAGFLGSLGLCILSAFFTHSVAQAATVLAASACICVPYCNLLFVNLPLSRLSAIASKYGAMVSGWPAVEYFSETNAVLLDAKDLFPRGTVILNGIRTFGGQRIDEAIMDAAALMHTAGGPLDELFNQIIKNRSDILPTVENPAYEDEKGVTGVVGGREILVGSRELLASHGLEVPSLDYEEKYVRSEKRPVYLAREGSLVAMFLVSYRSDRRRAMELRRMENNGISVIIRTRDPNITPLFLADCFGLSQHSFRVLPEKLGTVSDGLRDAPPERAEAMLATKGRTTSMMRILAACIRQRGNIMAGAAFQAAAVALGFALAAFFVCFAGLQHLSATALLIYEAFWTFSILFFPRLRRP